jgi:prepilin-type N-terminal cleavage/methylation domain-containing protein/prepilin-type processing-associated H-X9-DG protein
METDPKWKAGARSASVRRAGFTLIELLVVVAIIALLLSILLPSLSQARSSAYASVCLTRLKNLGTAQHVYQNDEKGYIPGSPLTTGFGLAVNNPPHNGQWQPGMPVNTFDYSVPLLRQMRVGLPRTSREACFELTTKSAMNCPANGQVAAPWSSSGPATGPTIKAISYLTMNTIMRGGPDVYSYWQKNASRLMKGVLAFDMGQPSDGDIVPPAGYVPRIDKVGRVGLKVYLADGLRFYTRSGNVIDYDVGIRNFAGYQSAQPPSDMYRDKAAKLLAREYNEARRYSYRHNSGQGINALMFDGHAERLRAVFRSDTQAQGPALDPRHYFPSGSVVRNPGNLFLSGRYAAGTALP